jgi:hypothetical protein
MNEITAFIIIGTAQTIGMIASLIVGFRLGQRLFNGCNDPYHKGRGIYAASIICSRNPNKEDEGPLGSTWYNPKDKTLFVGEGKDKDGNIWTQLK